MFSREGVINAYKLFSERAYRDMTMEVNMVRTDAMLEMMELGFTPEEIKGNCSDTYFVDLKKKGIDKVYTF